MAIHRYRVISKSIRGSVSLTSTNRCRIMVYAGWTFRYFFVKRCTRRRKWFFLRSNICFSIIITSPIFVLMNYDSNRKMCTVRWEDIDIPRSANYTLSKFERNYYSTLFSVTFILPSAILVIFYVMLSLKVHDKFCTFSSCFVILYMIRLENLLKNKNEI